MPEKTRKPAKPKPVGNTTPKAEVVPPESAPVPKGRKGRLTDQQRVFCEHLNRGMTATEAARKAGYSESYANREANQLLDKPQIIAYMDKLRAESRSESVADGKEVREYLTAVLRGDIQDVATGGKDLDYIETPMPAAERTRAAQELAKLDGLYAPTRVDVKVAEYSRDWLKQALAVVARYVTPDDLRKIAGELPRFDP